MNDYKIHLNPFIFIVPIISMWFVFAQPNWSAFFTSTLVFIFLELLRQYFNKSIIVDQVVPKQLYFFGITYKDGQNFFLNRKILFTNHQTEAVKKLINILIGIFLFMVFRFNSQLSAVNMISVVQISLIGSLWVNCKNFQSINRILIFNFAATTFVFFNSANAQANLFLVWLFMTVYVQIILQACKFDEPLQLNSQPDEFLSHAKLKYTLALVLVFWGTYQLTEAIIPQYAETTTANGTSSELVKSNQEGKTNNKPLAPLPATLLKNAAEAKLKAENLNFTEFKESNFNIPKLKFNLQQSQYGRNQAKLSYYQERIIKGEVLTDKELNEFSELAKNIKFEMQSNGDTTDLKENNEDQQKNIKTTPNVDKSDINEDLENMIRDYKKISNSQNIMKNKTNSLQNDDPAIDYLNMRNKFSKEIDNLSAQDKKNSLKKEEKKLQILFDKLVLNLKKFSVLLLFASIAIFILAFKKKAKNKFDTKTAKNFSISKELRVRLKDLYKHLLNNDFTAKDEVLKSYYILELAFKEIDLPRSEYLPPALYADRLSSALPTIATPVRLPINLFNRVFYGEKNPSDTEIKDLRVCMREIMKKLRVI